MRKKVLALVMVIALLPTAAFAADYTDTTGNWAEAAIDRWTSEGIVEGNPDGTFAPDNNIKRSEFAKIVTNLIKITETADLSVYTDVDPNGWYVEALEGVVAKGIMKGTSATTLGPGKNLTREQMFVMICRALGVEPAETCEKDIPDAETASDWSIGYINALVNMGVINGVDAAGDVAPLADIQRGATMAVLDRLIGGYANEDGQTVEIVPGKITLVVADEVKIEGNADSNLPIVVAGGAAKVDMEGVEGEATVQVQVSNVAIENAPVGTEIVADETATGVTANGIDVSGDADKDIVIPGPTTPAPSSPAPAPVLPDVSGDTDKDIVIPGPTTPAPSSPTPAPVLPTEAEEPTITQNGTEIEGVMYRPDGTGPFPTVILTHGFSGNYTYITGNIAKELSKAGFAAYAFNLRNPDTRSMWNTSVLTEAATLNTVIDQVKQLDYVDASQIFLLGESQGGFVSAYVAANREDIQSLILYYPAFVLQDDAKKRNPGWDTPGYEFEDDVSFGVSAIYAKDALSFDIYDEIGKFKNDVLIIHGTQDDLVPLSYSERAVSVYDHAELKTIEGAGHGFYSGEPFTISTQYTTDFLLDQIKE